MAKPGKKKKSCEKYKNEGHLEKNKELKAKRNQKRIEKFANKKPSTHCGVFVPANQNKTEFEICRSVFDKLDREIAKEKMEEKRQSSESPERGIIWNVGIADQY